MSILNSKFDITSVESPHAVAAVAQVLEVAAGTGALYSGSGFDGGTPVNQADALFPPGAIVEMDANGKAVLATSTVAGSEAVAPGTPKLLFVTIDGNTDYSGKFVRKLTCLHGGVTMVTDQFVAGTYTPGAVVHVKAGKLMAADSAGAIAGARAFGFVGPKGNDTVNGTLEVIVPQGCGI